MAVKKAETVTRSMMSAEDNMIQELIEISRTLEKYRNVRALDTVVYIIDGYLEDLDNIDNIE